MVLDKEEVCLAGLISVDGWMAIKLASFYCPVGGRCVDHINGVCIPTGWFRGSNRECQTPLRYMHC